MCGRLMQVTAPDGGSVTVKVVDTCPTCAVGSIALSVVAYAQLASPIGPGVIRNICWRLL